MEFIASPLADFGELVQFENALLTLNCVRNLHAKDFHNGVARFVLRLSGPSEQERLVKALADVPGFQLSVLNASPGSVQVRVY